MAYNFGVAKYNNRLHMSESFTKFFCLPSMALWIVPFVAHARAFCRRGLHAHAHNYAFGLIKSWMSIGQC